jgi:hypothetical protein
VYFRMHVCMCTKDTCNVFVYVCVYVYKVHVEYPYAGTKMSLHSMH